MFSRFGAITQKPYKSESEEHGQIKIELDFFKINNQFSYAIKAVISSQVFSRYPHPDEPLFNDLTEARAAAYQALENFCSKNKLKKQFSSCISIQPSLFD